MARVGAEPGSLVSVGARIGAGVDIGGGGGVARAHYAPLTLGVDGEFLLRTDPEVKAFVGAIMETAGRLAIGAQGGVHLRPAGSPVRLGVGAIGLIFPYTLVGGTASAGYCRGLGQKRALRACAELVFNLYPFGSDLPAGGVVTQILGFGAVDFDVW